MKKLILTTLVLGVLVSTGLTDASGNTTVPSERTSKITKVTFKGVDVGDQLYIKDSDGKTLYSEKIRQDGSYTNWFDLSQFPEDEYYFEVDKNDEITVLPFSVSDEQVTINKALRNNIVKPRLVPDQDNTFKVFLSRDSEYAAPISVSIYYEGRDLVYSKKIDKVGQVVQKYDFSTSVDGEYLFYIKYNDRTFMEYVNVL